MKKFGFLAGGVAVLALSVLAGLGPVNAADHGDAPMPKGTPGLDINDVYVFGGATDDSVVFALTVNPLTKTGEKPSFITGDGLYQIKLDTNGDAIADVAYNVKFGVADDTTGVQTFTVRQVKGSSADLFLSPDAPGSPGAVVIEGTTTVGTAAPTIATDTAGTMQAFAGLRDDPFFFDLDAFKAGLKFAQPGTNFFAGLNVSAIVLEVPIDSFLNDGDSDAAVWGITARGGQVVDRMGRPAINTVFIPADQKDAFNNTKPAFDTSTWKDTLVDTLDSLGSDPALADALLPDFLTFDTAEPFGFLNGRQLEDDVIDAELQLITGSPAATDYVENDSLFSSTFPYLGAPDTGVAAAPPPAAPAPQPAPRPTGPITAPDTGTGDASGGSSALLWLALGVAGIAVVSTAGGFAIRGRK